MAWTMALLFLAGALISGIGIEELASTIVALVFLAGTLVSGIGIQSPVLLVGLPLLGFSLPRFILKRTIRDRRRRIRLGLPDALDLMVISTEAGLSLDKTVAQVSKDLCHAHPDLSEEFYLVSREMRAGIPWDEALNNFSERVGLKEIKALTQAGLLGILQTLRTQSDSLRSERCRQTKRRAMGMDIVLAVFFLPLLFVMLGPTMIQAIRALLPEAIR